MEGVGQREPGEGDDRLLVAPVDLGLVGGDRFEATLGLGLAARAATLE